MADYLDNKEFHRLLLERHEKLKENPDLPVSEEIGKMIYDICTNLQYHRDFIRYDEEERVELVGDGMENCIRYLDNYDPVKYHNPHAYFTKIARYAFIRRIMKIYKHRNLKEMLYDEYPDNFYLDKHDVGNQDFIFQPEEFSDDNLFHEDTE